MWVVLLQVWKYLRCLAVGVAQKLVVWRLWIVLAGEVIWSLWIVASILALALLKVVWWIGTENRGALEIIGEGIWIFLSYMECFPGTWIVWKRLSVTQEFLELSGSRVLEPNVVAFKSTYT